MKYQKIIFLSLFFSITFLTTSFCDAVAQGKGGGENNRNLISKDSILIGDQILWSKEFSVKNGVEYQIIPYSYILQGDTAIRGGVEVVEELELEELSVQDDIRNLRARMLLTSFDSGSYTLPSPIILFRLADGSVDTLSFETAELYVNNLGIDTTSFTPYQIKEQASYPFSFKLLLPWILGLAVLAILIVALILYLKYRRDKAAGKFSDPPHIVALKKLEKLRTDKVWQSGREKQYYSGITDTLKEYIEARYGVGAVEMTSAEIIEALKGEKLEGKLFEEFSQMLSLADLVKFAKHSPSITENENSIHTAVNFVNYSYMRELEMEKEKKGERGNQGEELNFYVDEKLKKEEEKETERAILNYKKED